MDLNKQIYDPSRGVRIVKPTETTQGQDNNQRVPVTLLSMQAQCLGFPNSAMKIS